MKRKFYLLFTALLMMAASSAWADKVQIGDLYYQLNSDGTAWVVYPNAEEPSESNPSAYTGDITVPSTVDYGETTYRVTRLNYAAFRWSKITSITLSEGLETLDFVCLQHCDNLKQTVLTIPNSVTTLGSNVISFDNKIKTVIIGTGVKSVGNGFAWSSAVTDVYINTTNVPSGDDYMFPSVTIHVNHDMVEKFKAASKWSGFSNYIGDADEASLNYKIGARVTQLNDLYDGELVYIQSSDLARYYCYFINAKTDGTFVWNGGYSDNYSVWRIFSTGSSNQYYFRNVMTGNYMMSYQSDSTDKQVGYTTSDKSSAGKVNIYALTNGGLGHHSYDAASLTRGWDDGSFNLNSSDWFHNAENAISSGKIFTQSGEHNTQFNIYAAEIDDGTGETFEPGKIISSVSDIKTNRAYTLITQGRGLIETNPDHTKAISTGDNDKFGKTNGSTEVGFNQWVLRPNPNGDGTYYLYNVAADKYLTADESTGNTLTDDAEDAMTINTSSKSNYFTFTVSSKNNRRIRLISGNAYFDTESDSDGPLFQIIETAVVEPDEIFENSTVNSLVLKDKVDYTPPTYSFTATSATYTRDMKSGVKWGTVMLPYAVSATSDVKFYEITNLTNDELTVTETTNGLTAGTPALFKRTNTSSPTITFSATDAEVVPDIYDATSGSVTLKGVYAADKITDAYYIANDKFWSGSFHIYPFRAYLTGSAGSNAFSILVDDDPTGITTAATTDDASDEIEGVYSVSGVKLSDLQKGINIIRYRSGKTQKVILK